MTLELEYFGIPSVEQLITNRHDRFQCHFSFGQKYSRRLELGDNILRTF